MMVKILIGVLAVLGIFLGYVFFQPSDFKISREILIHAPPQAIFPYINNSKKANDWMPWAESDPQIQMTFSGPEEGVGSTSSWQSPGQMGVGKAVVIESIPNQTVKTQLTYTKPMEMTQLADVSLSATTEGTIVRWLVTGQNTFIGRVFCVFMDMDKMVGSQFEKGLNKLKNQVEGK